MDYSTVKSIVFAILFAAGMGGFAWSVWRMIRLLRLGQDVLSFVPAVIDRIGAVVYFVFMQRRVVAEKFGWNHVIFFWGFMIITVGHTEFLVRGVFPAFSMSFLGKPLYNAILIGEDLLAFVVLFAVAAALFRRAVLRPSHIHVTTEGYVILGLIAGVMVSYFLAMGFGIAGDHPEMLHEDVLIISNLVARGLSVFSETVAFYAYEIFWWTHALVLMTFLNVIPLSKHLHLLGAIPNIFVHKKEKHKAALERIDFETAEVYGKSKFNEFSWKALLDTYACTHCGRCDMYCPARRTGKALEPQQLIHDLRDNMYINGDQVLAQRSIFDFVQAPDDFEPELPLIAESEEERKEGQTSPEVLWGCTNCGACVQACPVLIDHVDTIMDMRRHLTLMEGNVQPQLATTFQNIERNYNPWGIGADKRAEWVEAQGLRMWGQSESAGPEFEYLFWVGCAGSYDNRAQKTVKAFTEIMDEAGVQYAVLGQKEKCTGDPLRRGGNEYQFDELAQENVQTLNELGVTKIVTACPHCLNTLKNEYPAFGGDYEVLHHTQLIDQLIADQRIELSEEIGKKVTYHDPCFLSRWNDETEAPRRSLAATRSLQLVEMKEHGKKSFCCGAGGAQMWQEEQNETRVNVERVKHAEETQADTIAVGCPFCMTMISDGVKATDNEEKIEVLDVAELVLQGMKRKKAESPKPSTQEADPSNETTSA
ncbi:MAG: (Fe-S)-binding protein [Myxococcota bacterium]